MRVREPTKRKDLVSKFRSPQAVDRLITLGLLKALDNDGNLAPWALGVECSGDSDSVTRAKSSLEIVLQALQNLYDVTPARKQISRHDVLKEVSKMHEDVEMQVIDRGLYFVQEFPVLDAYGLVPGPVQQPLFNLEWMVISEAIVTIDLKNAWNDHIRGRRATLESGSGGAESESPRGLRTPEDLDRKFARLAIEEARRSVPEDGRVHPRVGVVVVKERTILASAHRGEVPQCHAEYIALEKKLADVSLSGATVYTTLEPCTSRNHPKVPCAIRLAERKVARVLIGMLDPDDRISGRGQRALRKAGIATELFPHDLMAEIEELNRDFIRDRESHEGNSHGTLENAKGLSASGTASAPPKVRVALKRGHVSNFLIEYANDEDEPIFIREARLFSGKDGNIELTEPLTPDDPSTWRVAPHCSATFGMAIVNQRDPAASLVKMNSNKGIFFETEIVLVASCEMRGQLSEVRQTLYVKVNATKPEIVPLV